MSVVANVVSTALTPASVGNSATRFPAIGCERTILANIYNDNVNIAIWQRELSSDMLAQANTAAHGNVQISMNVTAASALDDISAALGLQSTAALSRDAAELVHMFCLLFDLKHAGLRLVTLRKAMCPKFHVDRIPCRLITTYSGIATQWLPHDAALDAGFGFDASDRNPVSLDQQPIHSDQMQQLERGHVALLKGSGWEGNEHAGLVHRSLGVADNDIRLLLTLDFVS